MRKEGCGWVTAVTEGSSKIGHNVSTGSDLWMSVTMRAEARWQQVGQWIKKRVQLTNVECLERRVSSWVHKYQHHLQKCTFLGPTPNLLNQNLWGWSPVSWAWTSSLDDPSVPQSLTCTDLEKFTPGEKEKEPLVEGRRGQSRERFVFQNESYFLTCIYKGEKNQCLKRRDWIYRKIKVSAEANSWEYQKADGDYFAI